MKDFMHNALGRAFIWNMFELWGYHLSLLGFQTWLYSSLAQNQFGVIGIWFSCFYMLIPILLKGFDTFTTTHVRLWSTNKKHCKQFFSSYIMSHVYWTLLVFSVIGALTVYYQYPWFLGLFLCIAVAAEAYKRCAKQICYYLYAQKTVAWAEIFLLWIYIASCMVLTLFYHLSYLPIILLHGIYTIVGALAYTYILKQWYAQLPESTETVYIDPEHQLWHSGYTFLWLLTSPNAFVLYTALVTDVATAGLCKLLFSYLVTIERLFSSSYAELSGIRSAWSQENNITSIYTYDFYIVPICTVVAAFVSFSSLHITSSVMCFMLVIACIDSIMLPLEKTIISKNNMSLLTSSRTINLTILTAISLCAQMQHLLLVIIIAKLASAFYTLYCQYDISKTATRAINENGSQI